MQHDPPPVPVESPAPAPAATAAARGDLPGRAWRFALREANQAARGTEAWLAAAGGRLRGAGVKQLRRTALTHPARLLGPLAAARRLRPEARFLAEAEALLTARTRGWEAAAPFFTRLATLAPGEGRATDPAGSLATRLLCAAPAATPVPRLAIPAATRPSSLPAEVAAGIVVYTAILGTPRLLPPVFGLEGRIRLVCFTDQPVTAPGWEIRPPAPAATASGEAAAAFHKILPVETLAEAAPEASASLWLDPDRWLIGNTDTFIARWLLPQALALWRSDASDWRALAEAHLLAGPSRNGPAGSGTAPAAVLAQAARFAAENLPENRGACDTAMIWRRHDDPGVAALTMAWWASWQAVPGADDLALYRALHGPAGLATAAPPAVLPARLGRAAENIFTAKAPRRPPRRRLPVPAGRALPVTFVSAAAHARSASTLLRGHQLAALVGAAWPGRYEVSFTEEAGGVAGGVVVLTKGALATLAPEAIADLARRNLAVVGCWDDIRPDPVKARLVDAHMTLSHRQTLELNRLHPETPAFLVTHHVNPQVPHLGLSQLGLSQPGPLQPGPSQLKSSRLGPPQDRLRTGYFGDLENTVRPASLETMVALVGIDTRNVDVGDDAWIRALPDYNCHWIVRRPRPWDGWKPFLKGFVAARCGAPVVTRADDGDAAYYLGDDYPFYARSLNDADLEMAMVRVAAAFGGPEWRLARDIMAQVAARCSDAQVAAEFRLMVEEITR